LEFLTPGDWADILSGNGGNGLLTPNITVCNMQCDTQNAECQLLLMGNYDHSNAAAQILGSCSLLQIASGI